jgi:hypothetical protein
MVEQSLLLQAVLLPALEVLHLGLGRSKRFWLQCSQVRRQLHLTRKSPILLSNRTLLLLLWWRRQWRRDRSLGLSSLCLAAASNLLRVRTELLKVLLLRGLWGEIRWRPWLQSTHSF